MAPTVLSLCSGYGGLELAVRSVWRSSRVVGYVEWEAFSAAVLLARMEDASLEPAPVWCGNLAELPTAPFLGVDLVTAGFPCQPWSSAGRGAGTDDERWIWPDIATLLRRVGPRAVFLENVPPLIVRGGLGLVLADLAALGFDAEWTVLRASDIGAPHQRERVFILAHAGSARRPEITGSAPQDEGEHARRSTVQSDLAGGAVGDVADRYRDRCSGFRSELIPDDGIAPLRRDPHGCAGTELGDAAGLGEREPHDKGRAEPRQRSRQGARRTSGELGDADRARCEGPGCPESRGIGRVAGAGFPPGPDDLDAWGGVPPGAQPSLRRGTDGAADWLGVAHASVDDQLRTLGNGVVPAQAAAALRILSDRLEVTW